MPEPCQAQAWLTALETTARFDSHEHPQHRQLRYHESLKEQVCAA